MLMTPVNDVAHIFTRKGNHPKVSNNNIKESGIYLKGQSPHFYIILGKPVVVAIAVVFFCLSSHMINLSVMYGETPSSMSSKPNLPL